MRYEALRVKGAWTRKKIPSDDSRQAVCCAGMVRLVRLLVGLEMQDGQHGSDRLWLN